MPPPFACAWGAKVNSRDFACDCEEEKQKKKATKVNNPPSPHPLLEERRKYYYDDPRIHGATIITATIVVK